MNRDYSFLRLVNDFEKSKHRETSPVTEIFKLDLIHLLPTESYLQITSIKEGIAFDQNYNVHLVDCNNDNVLNITDFVGIQEFTDENGTQQIAFEIAPINQDFYYLPLQLKFTHTVSNQVWWSSQFIYTNQNKHLTTRFDYRNYSQRLDKMQSIRVSCWFDRNEDDIELQEYFQVTNQLTISGKPQMKRFEKYFFERGDNFVYNRMKVLLTSDLVFLDGARVTNKTTVTDTDRLGVSNLQKSEFKVSKNYNETFEPTLQILQPLEVVELFPLGVYTSQELTPFRIDFNRAILPLEVGTIATIAGGINLIVSTFTIIGNVVTFNVAGVLPVGAYSVTFNKPFKDILGNELLLNWTFNVQDGDYNNLDYSNDYFI